MSNVPQLLTAPPPAIAPDVPSWLARLRASGWDAFSARGLPGPRVEEWKYTRLGDLAQRRFRRAPEADKGVSTASREEAKQAPVLTSAAAPPNAYSVDFHNGHWCASGAAQGALPAGVTLMPLRQALQQDHPLLQSRLGQGVELAAHPFAALNTRWFEDGLLLHLAAGVRLEWPLLCRFRMDMADSVSYPRLLVLLEAGSQAQLLEEHQAVAQGFSDLVAEIWLAPRAHLFHGRVQRAEACAAGDRPALQIDGLHVTQAAGSRYHHYALQLGGGLHRIDLQVSLEGEGAEAQLDGLYLVAGRSQVDNHLRIDHRQPGGCSGQFYKGILTDHGHAVFNGLAVVHSDAQRSDARQINRNLLLSPGAEVDTKPELQIEADDVQCSHGATVGTLDPQALFYLCSRGIPQQQAQVLLTWAFAHDTLQHLSDQNLRTWLQSPLVATLNARFGGTLAPLEPES